MLRGPTMLRLSSLLVYWGDAAQIICAVAPVGLALIARTPEAADLASEKITDREITYKKFENLGEYSQFGSGPTPDKFIIPEMKFALPDRKGGPFLPPKLRFLSFLRRDLKPK